jgi:hypothetical protein
MVVVTHVMANVPAPEFQKLWSKITESLRLECENTIFQHSDADAVMELVRGVLASIAHLVDVALPQWAKVRNGL